MYAFRPDISGADKEKRRKEHEDGEVRLAREYCQHDRGEVR